MSDEYAVYGRKCRIRVALEKGVIAWVPGTLVRALTTTSGGTLYEAKIDGFGDAVQRLVADDVQF